MLHISIAAEKIGEIFGFPITNSLLTTWVVMAILTVFSIFATRNMSLVPSNLQLITETLIGGLYDFFEKVVGKYIKQLFPLLASFFLFIIISNWFGLLPGVGTVGYYIQPEVSVEKSVQTVKESTEKEFIPMLRAATADINMTLALALIAVFAVQYFGFKTLGFSYSKKFIDISNPINFFLGLLEIISEISRIISFAFRLFGNIFAGEVLLAVIGFLMPFIAPLPFLSLEIFVGFIQALVFSLLAAVFMTIAVSHGEQSHKADAGAEH
jgi:F-type H+-transporting ATPase subunit a